MWCECQCSNLHCMYCRFSCWSCDSSLLVMFGHADFVTSSLSSYFCLFSILLPYWNYILFAGLQDIDYVLWTGDIPPHDIWNQSRSDQVQFSAYYKYCDINYIYTLWWRMLSTTANKLVSIWWIYKISDYLRKPKQHVYGWNTAWDCDQYSCQCN